MTSDDEPQGRLGARASGGLVGLGSAGSGLTVGPETLLGKILILASPVTSVLVDYAVIHGSATLRHRSQQRLIRQARRTLEEGIKAPETTDERRDEYQHILAELKDREIARSVARALDDLGTGDDLDSIVQRMADRASRPALHDVRQSTESAEPDRPAPSEEARRAITDPDDA